ncbi:saccharopine dehydrogenase family protein [Cellulosimicrobium sp. NPDC057127]|uniref:saccharopine dehydrogenase family protein n=1 Tax=Cellulosimicrobium sp. NPDC057127 TaxID=3346026 RepID=UPI0036317D83
MTGRIVLLGATGYTGRLVAHELAAHGARPVLAARSRDRLDDLEREVRAVSPGAKVETAVADVEEPRTVRALVGRGDVLVSTVGPFTRRGGPAVRAAVDAGAVYLDSTGEPAFIREVFETYGPRARESDAALLTAFGYDWVPGNVAGTLALREAGDAATRLSVGYFGSGGVSASAGTRTTAASALVDPSYAWRDGRLRTERIGARVVTFDVGRRRVHGISAGGTEPFTLPRLAPGLRDVDVVIGTASPAARLVPSGTALLSRALRAPAVGERLRQVVESRSGGPSGAGPDAAARAASRSHVLAVARDAAGAVLARVRLDGPDPYDLTARFLATGATWAARDGVRGTGALGPVEAFGLGGLLELVQRAGVVVHRA